MEGRRSIFIVLLFLFVIILLFWFNVHCGVKLSLIWLQSPELDSRNILNSYHFNTSHQTAGRRLTYRPFSTTESREIHADLKLQVGKTLKENEILRNRLMMYQAKHESDNSVIEQCQILNPEDRFDCFPENTVTESGCVARGCCWHPTAARQKPLHTLNPSDPQAPVDVPYCYYPRDFPGYTVTSQRVTDTGFQATLQRNVTSYYPGDVMKLMMDVKFETSTRLHVKLYDPSVQRFEVPLDVAVSDNKALDPAYTVSVSSPGDPFSLTVRRKDSPTYSPPIFTSAGAAPLIFTDQFLQLSSFLPSRYIYGLGQHRDSLLHSVNWTRFTMWNRDQPPVENMNLYGSHPFYLLMEEGGVSHGFFLLNSNAMDVILQPAPAVTWKTIGGILDFYFFLGPSPASVVQQYTDLIGQSFLPPYWSLGLHICRFGFKTVNDTMAVVNRVRKYGIPQDVQWNDIDYAIGGKDFTVDLKRFGDQPSMVELLHSRGMHYVILLDPGISSSQPPGTYPPYDLGVKYGLFVKNDSDQHLIGKNWPGDIVWPDFSHPAAQQYWSTLVRSFHEQVKIDGLWLDMDEVSNFVDGSVWGCANNSLNYPPYTPAVDNGVLHSRTMCPSARQHKTTNYNLHNIYNVQEVKTTYKSLRMVRGKRPFIISRATYPGMSRYGGHWSGDNAATFYDLYKSISELLSMSLSGVAMSGSDICGFRFNTTAQLCQRWYQLGAFYPFSRNHNDHLGNIAQDPGAFGAEFAASVRKVYLTRYSLLPYLYTLFYQCHLTGETVARPLFVEFSNDVYTYSLDRQFLWGAALLISPVLQENATSVEAYFPSAVWYDFYTGQRVGKVGTSIKLNAPLDVINLHVRGGFILPMQTPALTTTESRKNKFSLLVALDDSQAAGGKLYWDNGDTLDTYKAGLLNEINFSATKGMLQSTIVYSGYESSMLLGNITIFGVSWEPSAVQVEGNDQHFIYETTTKVLRIPAVSPILNLLTEFKMIWN